MKFIYEFIGCLSRESKLLRIVFNKIGILSLIRKKGIKTIIRLNSGELFHVYTKNWIDYRCFITGLYDIEAKYESVLLKIAKSKNIDYFFDIGANHGYYSIKVSHILPQCTIYSFEPFSYNVDMLQKNIELNHFKNITIIKKAVSDKEQRLNIYFSGEENDGSTSCIPQFENNDIYEEVEAITIDKFIKGQSLEGTMLFKIDVEGFELNVLKGMRDTLRTIRPILFVEHNDETAKSAGYKLKDIVQFMAELNYNAYDISEGIIKKYIDGNRSLVLYCHNTDPISSFQIQ